MTKRIVEFINSWKLIIGFVASTGIVAASHNHIYNQFGRPLVQSQIDVSLKELKRNDSLQNIAIRRNAEYGIKSYLVQKHTVDDSIIEMVEKEYSVLFGDYK